MKESDALRNKVKQSRTEKQKLNKYDKITAKLDESLILTRLDEKNRTSK